MGTNLHRVDDGTTSPLMEVFSSACRPRGVFDLTVSTRLSSTACWTWGPSPAAGAQPSSATCCAAGDPGGELKSWKATRRTLIKYIRPSR